jgi:hypothetical protein
VSGAMSAEFVSSTGAGASAGMSRVSGMVSGATSADFVSPMAAGVSAGMSRVSDMFRTLVLRCKLLNLGWRR